MKHFQVDFRDIQRTAEAYQVSGRSVGDEPISLGDFLNGLEVVKIYAYGRELDECPPGLTAALTLSFTHRKPGVTGQDWFLLYLTEDR